MMTDGDIYRYRRGLQTRWASEENPRGLPGKGGQSQRGRKGAPCFAFAPGEQKVLAEVEHGSGMVRRMWMTLMDRSPVVMRGVRLDMYWDGQERPAVSAPWGDFFNQGLGRCSVFDCVYFSNPQGRSFNCFVPMPFRNGMRIVLTNESPRHIDRVYYDVNYTVGDKWDEEQSLYLHAHWRREAPTIIERDYEYLPWVVGRGRFLGGNLGVIANTELYGTAWWGEGEFKFYLDQDGRYPSLVGTGVEDYIGTAWGQQSYVNHYQGSPVADRERFQYAFYRYHVPDPVQFHERIRVTVQQIGGLPRWRQEEFLAKGTRVILSRTGRYLQDEEEVEDFELFERSDDWSSCAFFYLDRPHNELPPLAPVSERVAGLLDIEVKGDAVPD